MVDMMFSYQFTICIIFLVFICYLYFRLKRNNIQIKRWQKSLSLPRHTRVFQQLYQDVDGFRLSRIARQTEDAFEYTYGEIEFLSFIALLSLVKPDGNTIFYDLGSGVGKAVIACAMVYPVQKSVGIELFPQLHASACGQIHKLASQPDYAEQVKKIQLINNNFLAANLHDATLIFINSTAFFGNTWEIICEKMNHLPQLKTVITTSKPLKNTGFSVVRCTKLQMSWGMVVAYIHTRKIN